MASQMPPTNRCKRAIRTRATVAGQEAVAVGRQGTRLLVKRALTSATRTSPAAVSSQSPSRPSYAFRIQVSTWPVVVEVPRQCGTNMATPCRASMGTKQKPAVPEGALIGASRPRRGEPQMALPVCIPHLGLEHEKQGPRNHALHTLT